MKIVPEPTFVLDAITLRGIGSYFHGARLVIKPLTILCGTNGSGKSTWLKALNLLNESLAKSRLPFGFAVEDWDHTNIQVTNAFCHLEDPVKLASLEDDASEADFGTLGTIGLEFHATCDTLIAPAEVVAKRPNEEGAESGWQFFNKGIILEKNRFRLRFAHPTHRDDSAITPNLLHVIELQYNGKHTIRMEGDRDPFQKFEDQYSRPRRSKPYTLSCSRSFLTGNDDDASELLPLACIHDLIAPKFDSLTDSLDDDTIARLLDHFEQLLLSLLPNVLDGFFYIGAIRLPTTSLNLQESAASVTTRGRYVGPSGENAWSIACACGNEVMRTIRDPRFTPTQVRRGLSTIQRSLKPWLKEHDGIGDSYVICPPDLEDSNFNACTEEEKNSCKAPYVFSRLSEELREQLKTILSSEVDLWKNDESAILPALMLASGLNELLEKRDLISEFLWATIRNEYWDEGSREVIVEYYIPDKDIESLAWRVRHLPIDDVRVLNHLLILDALGIPSDQECLFTTYLSSWLQRLIGVGLNKASDGFSTQWNQSHSLLHYMECPTLYLRSPSDFRSNQSGTTLVRLDHKCFGGNIFGAIQPPRQMSSGFHQLFPILVQLGVMKSGELLGIENPEVHLHPGLQISVMEALLDHAASGRRIIVETHSDLMLRRVIRAILEEKISQSMAQIYFTRLSRVEKAGGIPFFASTLEPIQTDSRGRISNWPEGFLDDDIHESQRLMDIMYGDNDQEAEQDDDN